MMKVIIVDTPEEGSQKAFKMIKSKIEAKQVKTLGLATGSTPLKLYEKMRNAKLDVSDITTINLDEYIGLSADDVNSYHYYMEKELFSAMNFKNSFLPNGMATDLQAECERFEAILEKHPIDIQILGIGTDGHIGFNEPGTPFDSTVSAVKLADATREANKRFFTKKEDVPTHALTMGIKSIMSAKFIILLAFGKTKAHAIQKTIEGPVDESCPASILQTHSNAVIIIDKEAGSLLKNQNNYSYSSYDM